MPSVENISRLIIRSFREELDEAGMRELEEWLGASVANRRFFEELDDPAVVAGKLRLFREPDPASAWERFLERPDAVVIRDANPEEAIDHDPLPVVSIYKSRWKYIAAAVIILVFSSGLAYWLKAPAGLPQIAEKTSGGVTAENTGSDLMPGGNKAVLILSDGRYVDPAKEANGLLAEQGGVKIEKTEAGEISYNPDPAAKYIGENILSTPRGGQYQIKLPDGTKVKLNAGSSLKYPNVFNAGQRIVVLKGEAYFEVAPLERSPFVVRVEKMGSQAQNQEGSGMGDLRVEALGTRFAISAYEEKGTRRTALFQGSVKVSAGKKSMILKPGFQAVVGKGAGAVLAVQPGPAERDSWMKGFFDIEGQDLKSVLGQVSRWYDTEIKIRGELPPIQLAGALDRNWRLSQVMNALVLQGEGKFKYQIEKNQLIISGLPIR